MNAADSVLRLVGAAAIAYLALVAMMYAAQRRLLYVPDRSPPSPIAAGLPEMTEARLVAADGVTLSAWWRPPPADRGVLVYLHGNAGNLASLTGKLRPYLDWGLGVLAIDWRGYGKSEGSPTEEGLYADGRAALDFLAALGIGPERVALHGESLGSGVATLLALERPVAALILEAPYTSVAEAAQRHYPYLPARWLVKDRFDSLARIDRIKAPILIVHGEADDTIPVEHGRRLLAAAAGGRAKGIFLAGANHVDLFDRGVFRDIRAFLEPLLFKI
jgi:fermentation-respiration switch protein FrsA (DUF1100 family)